MRFRKSTTALATSVVSLVAACCLTIVPGAEAAGPLRVGANYALTSNTPGRGVDVPSLAVDPTNPAHIVEANVDPIEGECEYHESTDGGLTWTGGYLTVAPITPGPAVSTPACVQNYDSGGYQHLNTGSIAFGSGKNVYISFSIHRGPFNRPEDGPIDDGGYGDDAVVAHSTDGGATFAPAVLAVPGGGDTAANPGLAGYGMRPQITVVPGVGTGGADELYVDSWNCQIRIGSNSTSRGGCSGGGGDRRIWVTRSVDSGATWSTPVLASAAGVRTGVLGSGTGTTGATGAAGFAGSFDEQAVEPAAPVVGPNGWVYVAYKNRDLTNGTTCPTNPFRPATTQTSSFPFAFPSSKAWCVAIARSEDNGKTWQQFSTGVPVPSSTLINPKIAISSSSPYSMTGELYVVYQMQTGTVPGKSCSSTPGCDPSDIIEQNSVDGGQTWSSPLRVNDAPGAVATNPNVAVGPGGAVDVIWYDQRYTYPGSDATTMSNVEFAQSTDDGNTFSANHRITDRSINESVGLYSFYGEDFSTGFDWYGPTLVPFPDGSILAAWPDSRGGSYDNDFQDIYLARLTPGAAIGQSTIATATPDGLSVDLSRLAYPGGPEAIDGPSVATPVTKLVVVNDSDVASALAGAVLARNNFGSMLLSPAAGLTPVEQAEAARMTPEGAYVIGNTTTLSRTVSTQLEAATRNGDGVLRIAPSPSVAQADEPADIARQIAESMAPLPTPTAVIVNPGTPDAAAGSALAASLDYPILFVDSRTTIPDPTQAAITSLGITKLIIVGGTDSVNSTVETALDKAVGGAANVTRLGGADQYATSQAVASASVSLGLPDNVVYVADGARPIDAALLGSAVARLGGLMLLAPGASTATAASTLSTLGLSAGTDRIVAAVGTGGTDPTLPPGPTHTLTVTLAGNGSGTVSGSGISCPGTCSQSLADGTVVTLTETPAAGTVFGGWSGGCGGTGTCSVTMSANQSVTASFYKVPTLLGPLPSCTAKIAKKIAKKGASGKLRVTVRCDQAATGSLKGTFVVVVKKGNKHGKGRVTKRFSVRPVGATLKAKVAKTLALKLPASVFMALRNRMQVSVTVTLTAKNGNGKSTTTAHLKRLKA